LLKPKWVQRQFVGVKRLGVKRKNLLTERQKAAPGWGKKDKR
jgi:hypothetical protein